MAFYYFVDEALMKAFDGKLTVNIEGTTYTVPASIHTPEEQFQKAVYPVPSIGIYQFGHVHRPEREVEKDWVWSEKVVPAEPSPSQPATMSRRQAPEKLDLLYQVTTHSYYAEHDRLLQKFIRKILPARGRIEVIEDGNTATPPPNPRTYLLHTQLDGYQSLDRAGMSGENEYRIFSKAFSYRIMGWLDESEKQVRKLVYGGITQELGIRKPGTDEILPTE